MPVPRTNATMRDRASKALARTSRMAGASTDMTKLRCRRGGVLPYRSEMPPESTKLYAAYRPFFIVTIPGLGAISVEIGPPDRITRTLVRALGSLIVHGRDGFFRKRLSSDLNETRFEHRAADILVVSLAICCSIPLRAAGIGPIDDATVTICQMRDFGHFRCTQRKIKNGSIFR